MGRTHGGGAAGQIGLQAELPEFVGLQMCAFRDLAPDQGAEQRRGDFFQQGLGILQESGLAFLRVEPAIASQFANQEGRQWTAS